MADRGNASIVGTDPVSYTHLSRYPYEIDLVSGRYTIDAKSLLGIYSLDLSNPLTLVRCV